KTLARIVPGLPYAGPVSGGGGARPHLPFAAGGAPGPGGRADRQPRGPPGKGQAPARAGAPSGGPAAALPAVADPAVHVAAVEAERRIQAVRDQARGGVREDGLFRVLVQHVVRAQGEGPVRGRPEADRGVQGPLRVVGLVLRRVGEVAAGELAVT